MSTANFKKYYSLPMILGISIILSGCTTQQVSDFAYSAIFPNAYKQDKEAKAKYQAELEFEEKREKRIGKHVDQFIDDWGNPYGIHKLADGGAIYTWKREQQEYVRGNLEHGGYYRRIICTENFTFSPEMKAIKWKTQGCKY